MQLLLHCKSHRWHLSLISKTPLARRIMWLIISAVCAGTTVFSQNITLSLKDAPLEKVCKSVEQQTTFRFVYTQEDIRQSSPVTVNVKNESLENLLAFCFRNQPLSYLIEEKFIIIKRNEKKEPLTPFHEVRGRVVNEKGEPMTGVSILVKGTTRGVAADNNGEFIFKNISSSDILVISGVQIETMELNVSGREFLLITTHSKVGTLDETVIIGYGKTTKRLNTGSVGKITAAEISQQPVSDPLLALYGRVPGVIITQTSGIPGSSIKVQIRGQNSLTQGSDPLFIIDGVPFAANNQSINNLTSILTSGLNIGLSPFASLNPQDIESIEILKDADATSIYGSRGANGVVLITTKKGKPGKTKVSADFYSGWSSTTRTMDMLTTPDYLKMRREAFANDGLTPSVVPSSAGYAPDLLLWDTTRYTDFKKLMLGGTAHTYNAQTSISGGNQNIQFLLSSAFNRETTVFPGDMARDRISLNSNITYTSTDNKWSLQFSNNLSHSTNNLINASISSFLSLPPDVPSLYTTDGKLNWSANGVNFENPLAYLLRKYSAQTENLLSHLQIEYKVFHGLLLKTSLGYNSMQVNEKSLNPIASQNPATNPAGTLRLGTTDLKSWIIEPQAEYEIKIGKGKLTMLAGASLQQNIRKGLSIEGSGYVSDNLISSLGGGTITAKSNSLSDYKYQAIFGRINYNWAQKYILNLSGRTDGSSRFGPGKQYANFAAAGAGWLLHKEKFIAKNLPFISYGKLRSSYGITGNDQIGDYSYLDTWNVNSSTYQGSQALNPSGLFNADYSWEVNRKFEAALELGFFKDRILFSVAAFDNRSDNQLLSYRLPGQTGFPSIIRNFPALIKNSGFEFELTVNPFKSEKLNWTSTINLSIPENKLLAFPTLATSSYATTYMEGRSLNLIYQLHSLGVDPATGLFIFEDVNKDNSIKIPSDLTVSGKLDPIYYGGFSNNITYKNFDLDFLIEVRKQTGRNYLYNLYGNTFLPGFMSNQPAIVMDRWQRAGDISEIQKFTAVTSSLAYGARNNFRSSTGVFSDASFARLKNISLSWNLPRSFFGETKNISGRLYVLGQNLITLTRYKGSDPEAQNLYALPPLKTLAAGIQITF